MQSLDHCTFWPDRWGDYDWSLCCAAHDLAYLNGIERLEADLTLVACVAQNAPIWMAALIGAGVLTFGWLFYSPRRKT